MSVKINPISIGARKNARLRQQSINRRNAEEAKLQQIIRDAAKSVMKPKYILNVNKGSLNESSVQKITQDYSGKLDLVDSVWAPWSGQLRK